MDYYIASNLDGNRFRYPSLDAAKTHALSMQRQWDEYNPNNRVVYQVYYCRHAEPLFSTGKGK